MMACTSDENSETGTKGEGIVTFTFKVESGLKTRTVLNGPEDIQHVTTVFLFVFKGTTDEATYFMTKQIPWPDPSGNDVNYQTISRSYTFVLSEGDYTFLAVGLDDQSGTTYNLPASIGEGTTLATATAVLAAGKTKVNIAGSEFFAGSATATVVKNGNSEVTINLFRRIAGIMGWFTNIPSDVTEIQIALYTQQNKSGYMKARPEGNDSPAGISNPINFKDYITSPVSNQENDKVLVSLNVAAGTGATVVSGGSYILPAAAPAVGDGTEYTIQVNVITGGTILKSIRTKLRSDDGLYLPSTGSDLGAPYRFPIVANHFYGIGSQDTPVDLGGDEDAVYIEINPNWSKIIDVPFE